MNGQTAQEFAISKGFEVMLYPDAAVPTGHKTCHCSDCNEKHITLLTALFGRWPSLG